MAKTDLTETEIEGAYTLVETIIPATTTHANGPVPIVLVVTGPDQDDEFAILGAGGEWIYLTREAMGKLWDEIARRLAL